MGPAAESAKSSRYASPRQVAAALGVSESSVKRWCDEGRLATVKTPGGHRKIPVAAVRGFAGELAIAQEPAVARRALLHALVTDDEEAAAGVIRGQWRAGSTIDRIADELVAPVLGKIGDRWAAGRLQIYKERRACELVHRCLRHLAEELPPPGRSAPRALGGTLEGDPFTVATAIAELVLRERGFDARSLGAWLPGATIAAAIAEAAPRVVWLAVATVPDEAHFLAACAEIEAAAAALNPRAAVVLGGRALHPELRARVGYAARCDGMIQLASFACALAP